MPTRTRTPGVRWRVLVFPGGTEIALEIHRSLRWAKEVELVSAGAGDGGHAPLVFREHVQVPSVHDRGWQEALADAVEAHDIDAIFPAHDDVLEALAASGYEPPAAIVGSPRETVLVARSKRRTHEVLSGVVPMAPLVSPADANITFPLFARPDRGQGSQGAMRVDDTEDLAYALRHGSDVITEFLPGRECTIDCFSDRSRGLLYAAARTRDRIRNGISVSSEPVPDQAPFQELARQITEQLALWGAWFFQTREDARGAPHVLEVAPRIAGTMSVSRLRGVNLPLLSLYEMARTPLLIHEVMPSVRVDRALEERVESPIAPRVAYVDLDDTLVFRGQVNADLVAALVSMKSRGVRLEVVTRHDGEPDVHLRALGLRGLFDAVRHLRSGEPKSLVITEPESVLIDDSFSERLEVAKTRGVLTIDCSMLALLVDDRF